MFEEKVLELAEKLGSFKFTVVYSLMFSLFVAILLFVILKILFGIDMTFSRLIGYSIGSIFIGVMNSRIIIKKLEEES